MLSQVHIFTMVPSKMTKSLSSKLVIMPDYQDYRLLKQGIIQKSAPGNLMLPFVIFDIKCPFAKSSVILTHFCVISRHFWVKLH